MRQTRRYLFSDGFTTMAFGRRRCYCNSIEVGLGLVDVEGTGGAVTLEGRWLAKREGTLLENWTNSYCDVLSRRTIVQSAAVFSLRACLLTILLLKLAAGHLTAQVLLCFHFRTPIPTSGYKSLSSQARPSLTTAPLTPQNISSHILAFLAHSRFFAEAACSSSHCPRRPCHTHAPWPSPSSSAPRRSPRPSRSCPSRYVPLILSHPPLPLTNHHM